MAPWKMPWMKVAEEKVFRASLRTIRQKLSLLSPTCPCSESKDLNSMRCVCIAGTRRMTLWVLRWVSRWMGEGGGRGEVSRHRAHVADHLAADDFVQDGIRVACGCSEGFLREQAPICALFWGNVGCNFKFVWAPKPDYDGSMNRQSVRGMFFKQFASRMCTHNEVSNDDGRTLLICCSPKADLEHLLCSRKPLSRWP